MLAQLQGLNSSLERSVQQYDLAQVKYVRVQRELRENRHELHIAQRNFVIGEQRIAHRLVALYTTPQDSPIEVILGARNLDEMLNRLDTAKSVTSLDTQVIREVAQFRSSARASGIRLKAARAEARRLVAEKAAKRAAIEYQIHKQQRLLASVKDEIAKIEAAQQARQLQLAREAAARLSQQHQQALAASSATVVGITATAANDTFVAAPSSAVGGGAVGAAMAEIGKPYVWAAAGPDAFDCSGLVMYAYAQVGVSLPHSSYAMWNDGVPVSEDQLEPGDLVFFDGLGHVGMYIGGGQFVHAPHTGTTVQISSLSDGWYSATYVGARRIL